MQISRIGHLDVSRFVSALLAQGKKPATVRKAYQLLAQALDGAVTAGLIGKSPCRGTTLPKDEGSEMRFLSRDEVLALADAIDPAYRALVLTAAYTGLRWGELAGLEVSSIDFLRRQVRVEQTLTDVKGKLALGEPKTKAARRTVTLPRFLVDELAGHMEKVRHALRTSDLVFTAENGTPLRASNFRRRIWNLAVSASVGSPLRFHDLRHTHAALLIQAGSHPKVIQSRLGHASITTTLDRYGHLMEGLDEAAADALEASWTSPLRQAGDALG